VLGGIFGQKRNCERLEKIVYEELNNLYFSPNGIGNQIKEDEIAGHVACMEDMRNAYKI
jgi:hypothetical protein